jgi:hypothetical protein
MSHQAYRCGHGFANTEDRHGWYLSDNAQGSPVLIGSSLHSRVVLHKRRKIAQLRVCCVCSDHPKLTVDVIA